MCVYIYINIESIKHEQITYWHFLFVSSTSDTSCQYQMTTCWIIALLNYFIHKFCTSTLNAVFLLVCLWKIANIKNERDLTLTYALSLAWRLTFEILSNVFSPNFGCIVKNKVCCRGSVKAGMKLAVFCAWGRIFIELCKCHDRLQCMCMEGLENMFSIIVVYKLSISI